MTRLSCLAVLMLIALIVPEREAAACSCAEPFCGAEDADVVFVGRVLAVWKTPTSVVARFRVERAAKGVSPGQIVAIATGTGGSAACSLDFGAGWKQWLINAHYAAGSPAGRPIDGLQTSLSAGFCGGSSPIGFGTADPQFPARSDIRGRVRRFPSGAGEFPPVAGARVWVQTPAGVVQTKTDQGGRFVLRNVPLDSPARLRVDAGPDDIVRPRTVASWTADACDPLEVLVEPRRPPTTAPRGR
jgi:hypothetical protein